MYIVGIHIVNNVLTEDSGYKKASEIVDIMNYTIDINRYNLDLKGITLVFEVKACVSVHILLSSSDIQNSSLPLYEIRLGGWQNTKSHILYRAGNSLTDESMHLTTVDTPNILNCTVYLPFWISYTGGHIGYGTGLLVGENTLSNVINTNQVEVRGIGVLVSYNYDRSAEWKIQLEDKFAGRFDSCSMDNNKADMAVVDDIQCPSQIECATRCGLSKTCMGYNFNSALNRCELLWFKSDVVTDIPHHIEAGWRFFSKCFNGITACLGCYF
ncbi:unnamed protein product [Mytilus coruscus]|uniref:Farnesoic acid O-methyl transferase domain-containing protein n=1 Tax=Mytilus coruscus TaxID=42192 RepID=A0A6J8AS43_MYTCO|nr:unnamed protein product [Mytilus coruscus]